MTKNVDFVLFGWHFYHHGSTVLEQVVLALPGHPINCGFFLSSEWHAIFDSCFCVQYIQSVPFSNKQNKKIKMTEFLITVSADAMNKTLGRQLSRIPECGNAPALLIEYNIQHWLTGIAWIKTVTSYTTNTVTNMNWCCHRMLSNWCIHKSVHKTRRKRISKNKLHNKPL